MRKNVDAILTCPQFLAYISADLKARKVTRVANES
jgi:hypothetical protein